MSISLVKGEKVNITKDNPGLTKILIGMGWSPAVTPGQEFDLDSSVFLLNNAEKIRTENDVVYFKNLKSACGSVTHNGDNRTGKGEGDDETILVDLSLVPADVEHIAFSANIYQAAQRNQNFGQVPKAYIRVMDADTKTELVKYDLNEDFSTATAVLAGELYRHDGGWKFTAKGLGIAGGFAAIVQSYEA